MLALQADWGEVKAFGAPLARMEHQVLMLGAQRDFYLSGMCLLLLWVIYRLKKLLILKVD